MVLRLFVCPLGYSKSYEQFFIKFCGVDVWERCIVYVRASFRKIRLMHPTDDIPRICLSRVNFLVSCRSRAIDARS